MKSNRIIASLNQINIPGNRRNVMLEKIIHTRQSSNMKSKAIRKDSKNNTWKYIVSFTAITAAFLVFIAIALPEGNNAEELGAPAAKPITQPTVNPTQTPIASAVIKETAQPPTVTHVQKTIVGTKVKLNINVDVTEYPGRKFGVYDASPLQVDHDGWYSYFFNGIDRGELTNYYDGWGEKYLELQGITDDYIKNTFAYIYGDKHNPEIEAYYLTNQAAFRYSRGISNTSLKKRCGQPENETARKNAESLSDEVMYFTVGNRFVRSSCRIGQPEEYKEAVYIAQFNRMIDGLAILLDRPIIGADEPDPLRIDQGEVWVMNGKVVYASAIARELKLKEQIPIITVENALSVLELNVDMVEAYSKDFIDGKTSQSEFSIHQIELMYYPVTIEDADTASTYAGKCAYATYRPVWCIASGPRVNTNFEYVMIIDAVTGKVIG